MVEGELGGAGFRVVLPRPDRTDKSGIRFQVLGIRYIDPLFLIPDIDLEFPIGN